MINEINEIFKTIVNKWRKQHGWTQKDLAKFADCEIKTIQRVEGGNYNPSERMISKIFSAFRIHSAKNSINVKSSFLRKMENASDIFECFIKSSKNGKDLIYDINIKNQDNREKVYSLLKILFELHDLHPDDYSKLKGAEKFELVKNIDDELNTLNELSVFLFGEHGSVPPDRDTKIKTYVYAYFSDNEIDSDRIVEVPNVSLNHYEQLTFTPLQYKYVNNNYEITKNGWEPIFFSKHEDLKKLFSAIGRIIVGGEKEVTFLRQMKDKPNVRFTITCYGHAFSLVSPYNPEGYQCTFEELFFLAKDIVKTISFLTNKRQGDNDV